MEDKNIKKSLKIVFVALSLVVLLFSAGYLVFQSPLVQRRVIDAITKELVSGTKASLSIGRVDLKWFRHLVFEEVFLSDESRDTLLFCQTLTAKADSFSIARRVLHFDEITARRAQVHLRQTDSTTHNFDFLLQAGPRSTRPLNWKISAGKVHLRGWRFSYQPLEGTRNKIPAIHIRRMELLADEIKLGPGSNGSFLIKRFRFRNAENPSVRDLSVKVVYADSMLVLSNLNARTQYSELVAPHVAINVKSLKEGSLADLGIDLQLDSLKIGLSDFSMLKPYFSGSQLQASCSGRFYGTLGDLRAKTLTVKMDNLLCLQGDLYLNGLPDARHTYIFANIDESQVNVSAIRGLKVPEELNFRAREWPEFIDNLGSFQYKGNFTGFYNDFAAYGTFRSNLGTIKADLSFKPNDRETTLINGHVVTQALDLGAIVDNKMLDLLDLSGDLSGWYQSDSHYGINFNGEITSVGINRYQYSGIRLDGLLRKNRFEGKLLVDDPNLNLNFAGGIDISSKQSVFNFDAKVEKANLGQLNLYPDSISSVSFVVHSNFNGKNIDDFTGQVAVDDLFFKNKADSLTLCHIDLKTTTKRDSNLLVVQSDWLDAELMGNYNFENLHLSAQRFYQNYLPSSLPQELMLDEDPNRFSFNIQVKNIQTLLRVFFPELKVQAPFLIAGVYQPKEKNVWLETKIPGLEFKKQSAKNLFIRIEGSEPELTGTIEADELLVGDSISLHHFSINSKALEDMAIIDLIWNPEDGGATASSLRTSSGFSINDQGKTHMDITILPSSIWVIDSLWDIGQAQISIDTSSIRFDHLRISRPSQYFELDGQIAQNEEDALVAILNNVDMKLFDPFLGKSLFSGRINGDVSVKNMYGVQKVDLDLNVDQLAFSGRELGMLVLSSTWDNKVDKLFTEAYLQNKEGKMLSSTGYIDVINNQLDLDVVLDRTPISILQTFMPRDFNKQSGLAEGKVKVSGPLNHFLLNGKIYPIGPISFGLTYLNTVYHTSDPVVLSGDSICFPNMKVWDDYNNTGTFSGCIKHVSFNKMVYDMAVVTDKIMVMNNTSNDSPAFYGSAFMGGSIKITGRGDDVMLSGTARSARGTQVNIPFETPGSAVSYNFIRFKEEDTVQNENKKEYKVVTDGITMDFDLELTPDAKVQLIINPQSGEIIKGEGYGNLNVKVDRNYRINMYGTYQIEKGDYLFTLQNVINKKFTIQQGGTLNWTGDPYNAKVDLKAVYKLNASLKDLLLNSYSDIDVSRRLPVDCYILLTEDLMEPAINFQIDLPTADDRVKETVSQVIVTEEDKNRQMISLLLLGRFYTPEFIVGTPNFSGSDLVQSTLGSTVSELLSNQISNWASQITSVFDVGINYRPGNEVAQDQFELALGTQILNDRVTLNGNIANDANPNSNNASGIVGDFDVLIKLTENGKLQFKAYTHSNDHLIYDTAPNTQGLGFTYKEEFNSFQELFTRYKEALFNRKKKKSSRK